MNRTSLFPNGQTEITMPTDEHGLLHGEVVEYHPHGTIKRTINYKHNVLDGEARTYREDGRCTGSRTYVNGTCIVELDGRGDLQAATEKQPVPAHVLNLTDPQDPRN